MSLTLDQLPQPLEIWEKIELIIDSDDDGSGHYVTRVEDYTDDGIVVGNPEFIHGTSLLRENAPVVVIITKGDAIYKFNTRISRIENKRTDSFLLSPIGSVQRMQRRRFARVDYRVEVLYAPVSAADVKKRARGHLEWKTVQSVNLSGGGILIRGKERLETGEIVLLKTALFVELNLPETLAGIIRRCESKATSFLSGIEFIKSNLINETVSPPLLKCLPNSIREFNQRAQSKLTNHVFKLQIELRQKGLL